MEHLRLIQYNALHLVDKNNTDVIVLVQMLTTLTNAYYVTIYGPSSTMKDMRTKESKSQEKRRKGCHRCHGLLTFIFTVFKLAIADAFPAVACLRRKLHLRSKATLYYSEWCSSR